MDFGTKIFFLFFGLSYPILAKKNAGKWFFNFLFFFFYLFRNFLARVEYKRNSGVNFFFFSFSAYLIPFWLKIMSETGFLIFSIFLLFFSKFSCSGQVWTEFRSKIFFFTFSAYIIPFWLKIMSERGFLIFSNFLLFFSEFSCPGRAWTEFGSKFFFSLSQPISFRFC